MTIATMRPPSPTTTVTRRELQFLDDALWYAKEQIEGDEPMIEDSEIAIFRRVTLARIRRVSERVRELLKGIPA